MNRWNTTEHVLGAGAIAVALIGAQGCRHQIAVEPIRVEPIHLIVDVNIRVDRQLAESFDFEDQIEKQLESGSGATTMPSATNQSTQSSPGGVQ